MKKILFVLIILALFLLPTQVFSLKIQAGDSWVYKDNLGNTYNESVIGNPYNAYGSNWASASINTSRPYPFTYYNYSITNGLYTNEHFNYSSVFYFKQYQNLEVSQLGAIPLASRNNFTALITVNNIAYSFTPNQIIIGNYFIEPNMSLTWIYGNSDPQTCFSTTQSVSYTVRQDFTFNATTQLQFTTQYVISSLSNDANNFTIQYQSIQLQFISPAFSFNYNILSSASLQLEKTGGKQSQSVNAYSFVLPNSSYVPTVISQTQPVPNAPSVAAPISRIMPKIQSTFSAVITYTLQQPSTSSVVHTSVDGFIMPIVFLSIITLVVIRKYVTKH